jgi:hypothetical protein
MATSLMRGGTKLRAYISEFLSAQFPILLPTAWDQWNLDQYSLPEPVKYDVIDPTQVGNDEYPFLGVLIVNDRGHNRDSWDYQAEQVYTPVFSVRILLVVRTPLMSDGKWETDTKGSAVRVRDDLTRLLQHILLQTPSMGRPGEIRLEESSITTDYTLPFLPNTQSKRWVCESMLTMDVSFTESTVTTKIGTANTIAVSVDKEVEE